LAKCQVVYFVPAISSKVKVVHRNFKTFELELLLFLKSGLALRRGKEDFGYVLLQVSSYLLP
jgi:hypothetical protein